jgi:uncharacterized protein (TIGR02001 family)
MPTQAEFNAELNLTSRYLHRGLNQSGDNPALQGMAEYATGFGAYVGVWTSTVEWPWDDRQVELDYFAGYQHRFNAGIAVDATLIRYTYQGGGVSNIYDWTEGQLTAHLLDHWSVTVSRANNWGGRGATTGTVEATYRYAVGPRWLLDGTLGHADIRDAFGFNYQWGELGLTRQIGALRARLAYSATEGAERYGDLARNRWLLSLSWHPVL